MKRKSEISPIGKVSSIFRNLHEAEVAADEDLHMDTESEILIRNDLLPALEGLGEFSHIWVIYCLERTSRVDIRTRPVPKEVRDMPRIGVFASKSSYRPNHIVMRLVELVGVKNNRIVVRGLDAANNSPVLDVQPYVPYFDQPDNPRVADWYARWMR